jgi:2-iminobutanoate/2-iminopropanoate deaminase
MDKQAITHTATRPNAPPYTPALVAGPFVFVSGQVGADPATGQSAGPDVQTQTRRALDNLCALLSRAGVGPADVVKTTVFLTSMADFPAMNQVYREYFTDPFPTRSTVGVAELARPELVVEIEAIALRGA